MTATLTPDVYQDDIALLVARVLAVANKSARVRDRCRAEPDYCRSTPR